MFNEVSQKLRHWFCITLTGDICGALKLKYIYQIFLAEPLNFLFGQCFLLHSHDDNSVIILKENQVF